MFVFSFISFLPASFARVNNKDNPDMESPKRDNLPRRVHIPEPRQTSPVTPSPAVDVAALHEWVKVFPQPVFNDALDPLNWSFTQKHAILAIVMAM